MSEGVENPLGLTRETAALINGLHCSNLTEFKKREISLEDLKYLTEEDLKVLDVGEKFDYKSFWKLSQSLKRKNDVITVPKPIDVFHMLEVNKRQLKVLEVYSRGVKKQLSDDKTDFFIEKNRNMKVSQAIILASNCITNGVENLENRMKKLKPDKPKSKAYKSAYGVILGSSIGVMAVVYYIVKNKS